MTWLGSQSHRHTREALKLKIESIEDQYAVVLKYWVTCQVEDDYLAIKAYCIPAGEIMDYLDTSFEPRGFYVYPREENAIEEAMFYASEYWEKILERHWMFYLAARPNSQE